MNGKTIAYIYSKNLIKQCDRIPPITKRASMVQDLIQSYNLLHCKNLAVVTSLDATEDELKLFHSSDFIEFLKKINDETDLEKYEEEAQEFGLGYDCPLLGYHYDFVKTLAGGSISAAKLLAAKKCQIAINWCGGWHHAQRDSAAGFCYINDIVLAIQILTKSFKKILYVDLDIHHGDGVQNAFELSRKILTLSFHKQAPGFYPGTGQITETGMGKGKYYALNIPLKHGFTPKIYQTVFNAIYPQVFDRFKPEAVVVQCGADCIKGDKIGEGQLNFETIGSCVRAVLGSGLPTLFLGGGGYHFANTARLWAYLTGIICGEEVDNEIPDDCDFFTSYAPSYELLNEQERCYEKDENSEADIKEIVETIQQYCEFIE